MRKFVVTPEGGRFVDLTAQEVSALAAQQAQWVTEKQIDPPTIDDRVAALEARIEALERGR